MQHIILFITIILTASAGHTQPLYTFNHHIKGQTALSDTGRKLINYSFPDSTKQFVNQLFHPHERDSMFYAKKDIVDIFISAKKLTKKEHRKRKHKKVYLSFLPSTDIRRGEALVTATNAAFYMGRDKHTKLSSFSFSAIYTFSNQFVTTSRSNVWTKLNRLNLVGDWRFMKYPQYTYGLGSRTKEGQKNLVDYDYMRFYQNIQRQVKKDLFLGAGYNIDYHYSISDKSGNPGIVNEFRNYQELNKSRTVSSGITFNALYDNRINSINPDQGWYATSILRINWEALGSDHNWQSLYLDVRKYIKLGKRADSKLAFWGLGWFTISGDPPYLDLPSMGWDVYSSTGRGYGQGRYRGKKMLYFESEYRFNLLKNGLIGGVVFANVSSFAEPSTNDFQKIIPAAGTGLRIKINKGSATNFAFDYAHGIDGSWGFFITIGEVF